MKLLNLFKTMENVYLHQPFINPKFQKQAVKAWETFLKLSHSENEIVGYPMNFGHNYSEVIFQTNKSITKKIVKTLNEIQKCNPFHKSFPLGMYQNFQPVEIMFEKYECDEIDELMGRFFEQLEIESWKDCIDIPLSKGEECCPFLNVEDGKVDIGNFLSLLGLPITKENIDEKEHINFNIVSFYEYCKKENLCSNENISNDAFVSIPLFQKFLKVISQEFSKIPKNYMELCPFFRSVEQMINLKIEWIEKQY